MTELCVDVEREGVFTPTSVTTQFSVSLSQPDPAR